MELWMNLKPFLNLLPFRSKEAPLAFTRRLEVIPVTFAMTQPHWAKESFELKVLTKNVLFDSTSYFPRKKTTPLKGQLPPFSL